MCKLEITQKILLKSIQAEGSLQEEEKGICNMIALEVIKEL